MTKPRTNIELQLHVGQPSSPAIDAMKRAHADDPACARAVHAALVVGMIDEGVDPATAHRSAARSMLLVYGIDMGVDALVDQAERVGAPSLGELAAPTLLAPARHAVRNLQAYAADPANNLWPNAALDVLDGFITDVTKVMSPSSGLGPKTEELVDRVIAVVLGVRTAKLNSAVAAKLRSEVCNLLSRHSHGPTWDAIGHAWRKVGAEAAGLNWGAFTQAVHYAPARA